MTAEVCTTCGAAVRVMSFKGTGVCSELCRKVRDGEANDVERALAP